MEHTHSRLQLPSHKCDNIEWNPPISIRKKTLEVFQRHRFKKFMCWQNKNKNALHICHKTLTKIHTRNLYYELHSIRCKMPTLTKFCTKSIIFLRFHWKSLSNWRTLRNLYLENWKLHQLLPPVYFCAAKMYICTLKCLCTLINFEIMLTLLSAK